MSKGAKAIFRAFDILDQLELQPSGLSLADLSSLLDLPKSTVHRLLQALIELRAVRQNPETGVFQLGPSLLRLSQGFIESLDLLREVRPTLEELNQSLNETVHLGVLDLSHGQVIYIDKLDSNQAVRMYSRVGKAVPVHCTALGKAMLSCLQAAKLDAFLDGYSFTRFTPNTIVDPEGFRKELDTVRKLGYATDYEEHEPQVKCVAASLCNQNGEPLAAISVSAPAARFSNERMQEIGLRLVQSTAEYSELLAHIPQGAL